MYECEVYLDSVRIPDDTCPPDGLSLKHPHRVKAANELAESQSARLKSKTDEKLYQNFIKALEGITNYIPAKAIQNLIHIFGGSDLLSSPKVSSDQQIGNEMLISKSQLPT